MASFKITWVCLHYKYILTFCLWLCSMSWHFCPPGDILSWVGHLPTSWSVARTDRSQQQFSHLTPVFIETFPSLLTTGQQVPRHTAKCDLAQPTADISELLELDYSNYSLLSLGCQNHQICHIHSTKLLPLYKISLRWLLKEYTISCTTKTKKQNKDKG